MTGILNLLAGAVSSAIKDTYFNLTTLLLPGDGTNGAQNNTFLDSSTNNFTITRNGNTTQGTFSPFSQTGWSNYLNGSTDYFRVSDNAAFDFGTGAFCIEMWFMLTADAAQNGETNRDATLLAAFPDSGTLSSAYAMGIVGNSTTTGTAIAFSIRLSDTTAVNKTYTATITKNVWHHIAVCRSGNDFAMFYDGSRVVSDASYTYTVDTNHSVKIGALIYPTYNHYFPGYISNLRMVKGASVYTPTNSSITVPTAALTAITNTSLLTCQSNRFVDNSSNAFAITVNGTPFVQAFSPFAPTAAYSAATVGGSGYFDGTGDYLQIAANSAFQFDADFTVECWFYSGTSTTTGKYDQIIGTIESATAGYWRLGSEFNGGKQLWFTWTTGSYNDILTSFSVSDNAWHHLAVSRISNSVRLFVDGVQRGSTTTVTTNLNANAPLMIMNSTQGTNQTQGYVSSVRIIKGQGLYNGTFTPPTAPFTTSSVGSTGSGAASSITGTVSILTNFTNAGITDATAKNDLETVGNAQISTTQSKFGGSSMYFDGTGDWLLLPASPNMAMGTGDFTFECWIYATAASDQPIYECRSTNSNTDGFTVTAFSSTVIRVYTNTVLVTATVSNYLNTWTHVAFTRAGSTNRLFINGTLQNTATASDNFSSQVAVVGGGRYGSNNIDKSFTGYIDDLRITKGYARYTASFTAPTAAFALQ